MEKNVSRKKFIGWSIGIGSLALIPAIFTTSAKKKNKGTTAKMLTQDGKLVEINVADIPAKKKKLALTDIHSWIRRKTTL